MFSVVARFVALLLLPSSTTHATAPTPGAQAGPRCNGNARRQAASLLSPAARRALSFRVKRQVGERRADAGGGRVNQGQPGSSEALLERFTARDGAATCPTPACLAPTAAEGTQPVCDPTAAVSEKDDALKSKSLTRSETDDRVRLGSWICRARSPYSATPTGSAFRRKRRRRTPAPKLAAANPARIMELGSGTAVTVMATLAL